MSKRRGLRRDAARAQFWRQLIGGFDPERTTVRQWCAEQGVSAPSFYAWRRELQRRDREGAPQPRARRRVRLLPVKIAPPMGRERPRSRVLIRLAGGVRLYATLEQLPAVLDVLTSASLVELAARSC